jgi:carboxyl-terminal processing protease
MIVFIVLIPVLQGFGHHQNKNEGYLRIFETIWKKVEETYFDPTFGGLDWGKIHDRYQPQIASAQNDEDCYTLVNKMLWGLNVSHAAFIPPGLLAEVEPIVFAAGGIGIDVRMLGGQAVITAVNPESPAYRAGLRSGFIIQAINGIPIARIEEEVGRDRPPYNERARTAQITKGILGRIYGSPETEVSIAYSDEGGEEREKKIARARRSGAAVGPKGRFFFAVEFEARRLDEGVAYIRCNTLQPQLGARISAAIQSLGSVSGVIIDLRGNSGGEIERMPDLFLSEKTFLYLRKARDGETKIYSEPPADVYTGPLVVLIDRLSGSASELFAACLQTLNRAVVVGERSPGSVMESDVMILPNGAVFMYPVAQLSTPDGTVLEGHGVIPDIEAGLRREMLLKGTDDQLDSALRYLKRAKNRTPKTSSAPPGRSGSSGGCEMWPFRGAVFLFSRSLQ